MKSIDKTISSINQTQRLSNVLTLKEGQLITGKITKFYPGNKAAVSLSGHQLVAQLDASLEANKHYLMQVKGTQPSIELKVIQNQEVRSYMDAAQQLLRANNEKVSRNIQLQLAQLLKEQLPIRPNQLTSLVQLMKQQIPNQNQVIHTMIKQNLPLNQETFQAVHQRVNQPVSISQTVTNLQSSITNMPVTEEVFQLSQRLSILQSQPISSQQFQESIAFQALKEVSSGSMALFQLFKKIGVITNQTSFEQWTKHWTNYAQEGKVTLNFSNPTNQQPLPMNLSSEDIVAKLIQTTNTIQQQLAPQENRALAFFKALASLMTQEQSMQLSSKLKSFFQLTQAERMPNQDYPTIQSLLNVVQSQTNQTTMSEPIQQLNQVLNSMHLSNHELTRDFMTFTAQLPKETLGLNQDLFMEFEGYKQKDGKLSPQHCRVIFYLDLPKLKETVMDLHVQKKYIDLIIFHEQPNQLKKLTETLIPSLIEKLEHQGYDTVHVSFKDLYEREIKSIKPLEMPIESGVDYRV
ncbi:hypothetical protein ACTWQB_06895 [Piscibacillus sp. B03]|uniref:hypothetical protein n=1 Tax=Piscibacillus sp. B03 TaxID=3457430 RepID=UPI003FCCF503